VITIVVYGRDNVVQSKRDDWRGEGRDLEQKTAFDFQYYILRRFFFLFQSICGRRGSASSVVSVTCGVAP